MDKKKLVIAVVAVLVTLAFVLLWVAVNQHQKSEAEKDALKAAAGCRVVDGKFYANYNGLCCVFDDEDQLIAQSALVLSGHEGEDSCFVGDLAVMGYEVTEEGYISGDPAIQKWANGIYTVFDHKSCRHNEMDEDGLSTWVEHPTRYSLTYYMREDDPDFLAVLIYDTEEYVYYVATLGDTEAEARAAYNWFKANKPSDS